MQDKKLTRREREKLRHRRQMLVAAIELFSEKGYHNVSMHEIAKRAEFAIGTLYKFFKNKEDLYKALIMEKAAEYHRTLIRALSREGDVLTILKNYISAKAGVFADDVATLRLYFAETQGASFNIKAGLDQDIRKLYDELVEQLASTLEKGIRKNVLRDLNPYYTAVALEGITNAFLFCWLEDPERHSYEANAPVIRDIFLKGVVAE
ncbi:TetR/AcrR family transcriptional regulator [Desulfosarcina ovata]|uniref:Fatty acid metabolism regulator protein n=1 Tax=Desulfosarcina ovata subsp. ovata TaxID=2752305 RepID=A0A5K8AK53_9BACT|nr:TetR/AcrR family transcriptional regulator [Desulfosarcina ovata]BBO93082.1 fatty acid metabolism regulator protein [Desulfosarcina ovata subsp. ovata]